MERQFFSGNSVEQAVLAAARHHGLDPTRVAYKLRDKKHGFLNIRRRVVIEVDPEAPEQPQEARRSDTAPPAALVEKREPRTRPSQPRREPSRERSRHSWRGEEISWSGEDRSDPESAAFESAVEELLELLDVDVEPSIRRNREGYEIELAGPDSGFLVADSGRVLEALEHLLPRIVRGLVGRGIPCRVDSEGLRAAHEQELALLARDVADDVRQELKERQLEPMSPADRRLVHMALAEDPAVRTESEGEGYMKRVRILPA